MTFGVWIKDSQYQLFFIDQREKNGWENKNWITSLNKINF